MRTVRWAHALFGEDVRDLPSCSLFTVLLNRRSCLERPLNHGGVARVRLTRLLPHRGHLAVGASLNHFAVHTWHAQ